MPEMNVAFKHPALPVVIPLGKTAVFAVYPSSPFGGNGGVGFFGGFKIGGITRRLSLTYLIIYLFHRMALFYNVSVLPM
jgi:hypothetical protein